MPVFRDKVVWITGAGSGIGRAVARMFAADGALLVLNQVIVEYRAGAKPD